MSLLHRNLLSAAFVDMLKKFEPIVKDTLEVAASIVAPASAPAIDAGIELADASVRAHNAGIPPAAAPPSAATSSSPAPAMPAANTPTQAVGAAIDALEMQLSQIATQLAALRANLGPPSRP